MNSAAVFGISVVMSFVSSGVAATLYVWPRLRIMDRHQAIVSLVAPHMFLRFIGLSVLVPGVVSPLLPAAWAVPAAYGDFVGVIFLIDAKTVDEARAVMEPLPLSKENLMDHEYIPVGPLFPLGSLIGAGVSPRP